MIKYDQTIALDGIKFKYYNTFIHRVSAKIGHLEKPDRDKKIIARLRAELACISFKFRSVFDSSHSYFIILNKQLGILDFNKASFRLVKKLFGKKMIMGDSILDFLHPLSAGIITGCCQKALAGEKLTIEKKIAYKDCSISWWSFEFSPAADLGGNITGVVINANDITKRKKYEEKIRSQHKKLIEISSMQSHEIRGPVSTIMGLMSLIKDENYTHNREYLLLLEITTEQLDKNIREIVDKASDGQAPIKPIG